MKLKSKFLMWSRFEAQQVTKTCRECFPYIAVMLSVGY